MNGLIQSEVNGKTIRRNTDNWFNLGDLAAAAKKARNYAGQWIDGAGREYIELAESKLENSNLLVRKHGGAGGGAIYAHPKIARRFAQAVSAEVAWHVDEIVEGKITTALPAEQSEAKLTELLIGNQKILSRLTDHTETTDNNFEKVFQKQDDHDERLSRLEKNDSCKRRDYSKKAQSAAKFCLAEHYTKDGQLVCPCCDRPVAKVELHHWLQAGGNNPRDMMPLHPECHKDAATVTDWHARKRSRFEIFQERCLSFFKSSGAIKSETQVIQIQPTLFGDIEVRQ